MSYRSKPNCYALQWSYDQICVHCGCCKRGAYKERIKYHLEMLRQARWFSNFSEDKEIAALQKKNIKANIEYEKRIIKELREKIKNRKKKGENK